MITIISGTNRPNSKTSLIASICSDYLTSNGVETALIDLAKMNHDYLTHDMYSPKEGTELAIIQDDKILPADLLLIISPEYNGSFPGILKAFIDALSVRKYNETFKGRKVALLGVAAGRAGNLRGMEHMTGFLNYLNMLVMPNKLPISSINSQFINGNELNESTLNTLSTFLDEVVEFSILGKVSV